MNKPTNNAINFNYDVHVKELIERFNRLIKQFGPNNKKGTIRYDFEVDFTYALNEIKNCPSYLQGKMFDQASSVVNALINQLKMIRETNPSELQDA